MTTQTQPEAKTEFSIHPKTQMGMISLTVANLDNQLEFYQKAMGFKLHWREGNKAGLGAGNADFLLLTEEPGLKKYRGVTGLYHVAYLFPDRRELAIAMARLLTLKYPNSPTDHIMTKTTYLDDLECNGIELYCESPEGAGLGLASVKSYLEAHAGTVRVTSTPGAGTVFTLSLPVMASGPAALAVRASPTAAAG